MISELRETGGNGGSFASAGLVTPIGHSQFIAARLTKNDVTRTPMPMMIELKRMTAMLQAVLCLRQCA